MKISNFRFLLDAPVLKQENTPRGESVPTYNFWIINYLGKYFSLFLISVKFGSFWAFFSLDISLIILLSDIVVINNA